MDIAAGVQQAAGGAAGAAIEVDGEEFGVVQLIQHGGDPYWDNPIAGGNPRQPLRLACQEVLYQRDELFGGFQFGVVAAVGD